MALLAAILGLAAADSTITVSSYTANLTPTEALPLGGYTARGNKVFEPGGEILYARVVLFRQRRLKVAVVSAELLTIPDSLAQAVRERIPKDINLFLCATHTHCAPDSQMLNSRMTFSIPGIAPFNRRWMNWYADQIASGVNRALAQAGDDVGAIDERFAHFDGNRGRRVGADPQTDVTLVREERPKSKPLFLVYAAHPVFHDSDYMKLSGDWPGKVSADMEVPVLQGAIGDVSPKAEGSTAEEKIENFAHGLETAALAGREERLWQAAQLFRWISVPIQLGHKAPHPTFAKANKIPEPLAKALVDKFAPDSASISAFRIGSLAVVGIPGEPSSHLGRMIRGAGLSLGFANVLVISHVDGWIGYLLDPVDYDRGGYEAQLNFYGREGGERVATAAIIALRKLRAP